MADLSVKYGGLKFKNPLICPSSPLTDSPQACEAAAKAGFAGVVLKSIFFRKAGPWRHMHAVPRFKAVHRFKPWQKWTPGDGVENMGIITAGEVGTVWTEEKYGWFIDETKRLVGQDCLVGASCLASSQEANSWEEYLEIFASSKADFVELDLGYPRFYKNLANIAEVVRRAKKRLNIPVTVKMAPYITDPVEAAQIYQEAGVDGITCFDSTFALDFDIEKMTLPFRGSWCYIPEGTSLSYTNRCIAEMRLAGLDVPISASFGVWEWRDVIKCIMSGADSVQSCRRIMVRGYKEGTRWLKLINDWVDAKGYSSLAELKGSILGKMTKYRDIPREEPLLRGGKPSLTLKVDLDKCQGCPWCAPACSYFALEIKGKKAVVNNSKCAGCGLCVDLCPTEALSLIRS